jgi:hypothetical protein
MIDKDEIEYELVSDLIFDWERENDQFISQFKKNLKDFDFDKVLREGILSKEKTVRTSITLSPLDQKIIDTLGFSFAGNRNLRFTKLINFLFGVVKSVDFYNLVMTGESRSRLFDEDNKILEYEFKKIKKIYNSKSLNKKIDELVEKIK